MATTDEELQQALKDKATVEEKLQQAIRDKDDMKKKALTLMNQCKTLTTARDSRDELIKSLQAKSTDIAGELTSSKLKNEEDQIVLEKYKRAIAMASPKLNSLKDSKMVKL